MIKEIKAYELYCDKCGKPFLDDEQDTLFVRDAEHLMLYAESTDEWVKIGGKDYHVECSPTEEQS